jgi:hypothetical protein
LANASTSPQTVTATIALAGTAASNYTLGANTTATTTAKINPKGIMASITAEDKTYDGTLAATVHCTLSGVLAGDTGNVSCSGTGSFANANAGQNKIVTSNDLALSGSASGNYLLFSNMASTTASINKANASTSVSPYSVTYNGAAHTATGTATGVLNESLSGLDLTGTTHTNAGIYTDAWTFADATGNYNNANGSVNDSIAKANAVINIASYSVTYDGDPHMATGTAKGVLNESLSGLNLAGTTHTNAGSYADSWTFTDVTGNYNSTSGTTNDSIAKANAVINVTSYSVIYDGNAHTATGTAKGVKGESLSGLNLTGTTHTNPGDYMSDAWTFTDVTGNYNNTNATVHDSITFGVCSTAVGAGGVILPPINSDGSSVYPRKGGSTIPVKFRVCNASGMAISNSSAVFSGTTGTLTMLSAVRGTIDNVNESSATDVPDAAFRWDASGQQWIFNMGTSNLTAGQTYSFRINLAYGPASIIFVVGVK